MPHAHPPRRRACGSVMLAGLLLASGLTGCGGGRSTRSAPTPSPYDWPTPPVKLNTCTEVPQIAQAVADTIPPTGRIPDQTYTAARVANERLQAADKQGAHYWRLGAILEDIEEIANASGGNRLRGTDYLGVHIEQLTSECAGHL